MQDAPKAVWSIPYVLWYFFPSLKHNFIAYHSSQMSDCIFANHKLWQSGFSRVYSNSYCSCLFKSEIIKIGQSSHKMYSNNIVNFQESTTILNANRKNVRKLIVCTSYIYIHIFKEKCPPHGINCHLGRKPGGSTRAEEKPIRDTAWGLRGKGLDMPCDSYWGWLSWFSRTLSHFVSFKNRNHLPQFESCFKSSSDNGAICIKLDLVESEKFSAWMKCTRNNHSHVIT